MIGLLYFETMINDKFSGYDIEREHFFCITERETGAYQVVCRLSWIQEVVSYHKSFLRWGGCFLTIEE